MHTLHRTKLLLAVLLLVVAAGCGTVFTPEVSTVESTTVTGSLMFFENGGADQGPLYNVSIEVPETWVGDFQTTVNANRMTFTYVSETGSATPIFYIEALSDVQYWEQVGSYPGVYFNL
ncbi:MAG: hypothetical protein AAF125_10325, partial [Chloroflexota bacterium]